jgi:hypothetical protein
MFLTLTSGRNRPVICTAELANRLKKKLTARAISYTFVGQQNRRAAGGRVG